MEDFMKKLAERGETDCCKHDSPITSVDEVFNWNSNNLNIQRKWTPSELSICTTKETKCDDSIVSKQEILYCHDMRGGYIDDACCYGNDNCSAFRFYHWHLIDIFSYFSHSLVVIPPVGWIDIAHRNGVRVLGCLMTEHWMPWGEEAFPQLFATEASAILLAQKLDEIRRFYRFEGWLINIESKVDDKNLVDVYIGNILTFLAQLKILGSEVVWYDAITIDGCLNWQNCLSPDNLPFYKASSSIFLNYTWTPQLLNKSRDLAVSLSGASGAARVFVGVDCYGRGCPGGGGWNIVEALSLIQKGNNPSLSIALFAPGWVYETCCPEDPFLPRNQLYWASIASLLPMASTSPRPIRQNCPKSTAIVSTSFCLGQGSVEWRDGEMVFPAKSWSCLGAQQIMPTAYPDPASGVEMSPNTNISFNGGSCLQISISPSSSTATHHTVHLFHVRLSTSIPLSFLQLICTSQEKDQNTRISPLRGIQLRFLNQKTSLDLITDSADVSPLFSKQWTRFKWNLKDMLPQSDWIVEISILLTAHNCHENLNIGLFQIEKLAVSVADTPTN